MNIEGTEQRRFSAARGDVMHRESAPEIISLRAWNGFGMVIAIPRVKQREGEDLCG